MNDKTFWTGIEYEYNSEHDQYGKLIGGFVYAFVTAKDARVALSKFLKALENSNISPIDVEYISPYNIDMQWDTEEENIRYSNLLTLAKDSKDVVFDDFYAYESE